MPPHLEVEEFIVQADLVVRIPRETAEAELGRPLADRNDFMAWIDRHRAAIYAKGMEKCLLRPFLPVGGDRTIILEPADFDTG
jgi:hypothetical protein